jgi:capsule polysaccharide modification protein KpsS
LLKPILILVDGQYQWAFYRRMIASLALLGYEPVFLTRKPSVYFELKKSGLTGYLNSLAPVKSGHNAIEPESFMEVRQGKNSSEKAMFIFNRTYAQLERLHAQHRFTIILIWYGLTIMDRAATFFAKNNQLQTVYLEIANFPNKIFVDPQGILAESLLYMHPEILDDYPVNLDTYRQWRKQYISENLVAHQVPQATYKVPVSRMGKLSDSLWRVLEVTDLKRIHYKLNQSQTKRSSSRESKLRIISDQLTIDDLPHENYLFFPMQVASDSQLLLFSKVDNLEAIKIAAETASQKGYKLFVKSHPAERNQKVIAEVLRYKRQLGFYFVNLNTFQLLKYSQEVYSINSTAGLQARILGKPVTFLGQTLNQHLDTEARLAKYILGYLVEIDFFGREEIGVEQTKRILARRSGSPSQRRSSLLCGK